MAYRLTLRHVFRHYSTFLSSNSSTPLNSREKSRALLRLLKSETNPERILEICRSTSLTLDCRQDHNVLSFAVTKLTAAKHFDIRLFADMNSYYIRDDGSCFFTLVHSFCEHGEFESALEIVKDNCYKGWFSYKNWFASFNLVKKLVNGLVGISKIDDAKELIKEIKEKFPESSDMWDEVEAGLPEQ